MPQNSTIQKLQKQLIRHEGMYLTPYRDSVGKLTIGVGRNLDDVGLSEEETYILLRNDMRRAIHQSKFLISHGAWMAMNNVRRCVIVNMVFNMGAMKVLGFKKMLDRIEHEAWGGAAHEMQDSKWARQVGMRATELAGQMRTGEWQVDYE